MGVYTPPDIDIDREAVYQAVADDLRAAFPLLRLAPSSLLDRLVRAVTAKHAELLEQLADRAAGEFEAFGEKVLRVPKLQPVNAAAVVTIKATDTLGHTLPAGAEISLADGNGGREMFATATDATIAPGDTETPGVTIVAVNAGGQANDLYLDPVLEQPLSWAATPEVTTAAAGGADGETADEYQARLPDVTALLGTTLTIPSKFQLAAQSQPGVATALAIDLYKPGAPYDADPADDDAEGHITVALRTDTGAAVDPGTRTATQAFLDANTASFLTVWAIDPTFTDIDVVFAGEALPGHDPATVEAAAEQAVLDFLSPARWGLSPTGDRRLWIDTDKVRFQDVSAVLNSVPGFDYWTSLTVNGGTSDITMTGPAAVPSPDSTADGTIT